jgi:hypothetical protein
MLLNENKKIMQTVLASVLLAAAPMTQAWVTPVDMDADHEGDSGGTHSVAITGIPSVPNVERCDTATLESTLSTPCHRRNLIWQLGSGEKQAYWNPELGGDSNWRLPTIKELARLVNYSSGKNKALDEQPLILKMFSRLEITLEDSWLISSTHRDIDGDPNNGEAQIFGLNMGSGEISAFDTVQEIEIVNATNLTVDHVDPENVEKDDVIAVSDSTINGTQTIITVTVGIITSADAANETLVVDGVQTTQTLTFQKCISLTAAGVCGHEPADIYALLVHTKTVSALLTPPPAP